MKSFSLQSLPRKAVVPIALAALSVLGAFVIVATAPSVEYKEPERAIPTVRTIEGKPTTLRHRVRTQGTVAPRTEAELVAEVSGRVVWLSPTFAPGGFFKKGDPLIRIETRDFELAVERQRATLQRAESEYEFAASELARREGLSKAGVASASQLADARRAASVAEAAVIDARAAHEQAQRDLERSQIRAPFDGRVREEHVDVGQFVTRGNMIGKLYATDYAEIRLPIPDHEIPFLDLPDPRIAPPDAPFEGPEVVLHAVFAGRPFEWKGRIVRTEGEIDEKSRMMNVVARVDDPYSASDAQSRPPLAVGLFVEAEIVGPEAKDVIVLPRYAMRDGSKILVVDAESRIHTRDVHVLRIDRDEVLIQGPLGPGERICVSPIQVVIENGPVRMVDDATAVAAGAPTAPAAVSTPPAAAPAAGSAPSPATPPAASPAAARAPGESSGA
ncbi:MAG: efflux RND transporter periplasmic adaptor subunit [Myxococcota bacterium]